ncbi:MAG: LamG-like jellyroll fold domain-containing protein, partial [Verrucomicrobiota bacterium]
MKKTPRLLTVASLLGAGLAVSSSLSADTIGYWRFDEDRAVDGELVEAAVTETNSPTLDGAGESDATYSNDVPGTLTQDPVSGASWSNRFSQNCSSGNGKIRVPNDPLLNPDNGFTIEFFIKLTGEPGGWHSFIRRNEAGDLRWQVDFNHSTQPANFGRIRSRWDTPDGDTNNVAFGGQIYIDTDTGSGNPDDYNDPEDLFNDGDGENDTANWRHVALTFDPELKEFAMFTDYEETGRKSLNGTFAHPDAVITIGKHNAGDYGLFVDEVRYSSGVLEPDQFLRATDDESDDDEDGLPDAWEQLFFGNLGQTPDGDPDNDGLSNAEELANTTKPTEADSDGDGLEDGDEVARKTDPNAVDSDGDLLADGAEVSEHQTDPADPDSDGDGFPDGVEIAAATDPTAAGSRPMEGNVYFVANERSWEGEVWSDGGIPTEGNQYFVIAGLADKLTNPGVENAVFPGDSLTISGDGAQLGLDRAVEVAALALIEGGALVSDGATFSPELTGTVTVEGSASFLLPAEGRTLTIDGPLNGSGNIQVDGAGANALNRSTATLAGETNNFEGTWTVGPGARLKVLSAGAIDGGDIVLNNGALDADYNINNPSGRLVLVGEETQIMLD